MRERTSRIVTNIVSALVFVLWSGCTTEPVFEGTSHVKATFSLDRTDAMDGLITIQQAYLKLDRIGMTTSSGGESLSQLVYTVPPEQPPYRLTDADSAAVEFSLKGRSFDRLDMDLYLFQDAYELIYYNTTIPEAAPEPPNENPGGDGNNGSPGADTDSSDGSTDGDTGNESTGGNDSGTPGNTGNGGSGDNGSNDNDSAGGDNSGDDDNGAGSGDSPGGDKDDNDGGHDNGDDHNEGGDDDKDADDDNDDNDEGDDDKDEGDDDKDEGEGDERDEDNDKDKGKDEDKGKGKDNDKDKGKGKDKDKGKGKDKDEKEDNKGDDDDDDQDDDGDDRDERDNDDHEGDHDKDEDEDDGRKSEDSVIRSVDLDHFFQHAKPALVVLGTYQNNGKAISIIFVVTGLEKFTIPAQQNGQPRITLAENNSAVITFNPAHWFQSVTAEDIETAHIQSHQGQQVLFIHPDHNTALYDALTGRLDESTTATVVATPAAGE